MHDLHPEYIKKIILHISKKNTEDPGEKLVKNLNNRSKKGQQMAINHMKRHSVLLFIKGKLDKQ